MQMLGLSPRERGVERRPQTRQVQMYEIAISPLTGSIVRHSRRSDLSWMRQALDLQMQGLSPIKTGTEERLNS